MSDFDESLVSDEEFAEGSEIDDGFGVEEDMGEEFSIDNELSRSTEICRQKSYEVLSEDQLAERSKATISEVKEVLGIPSKSACLVLLRHFKYATTSSPYIQVPCGVFFSFSSTKALLEVLFFVWHLFVR